MGGVPNTWCFLDAQRAPTQGRLSGTDQAECARLDRQLPPLEARASSSDGRARAEAEVQLYQARKRFCDLKC